jgi:hypothetical protein
MSRQHHPSHVFGYAILFLLLLLTFAVGPIGFVVLVMIGAPIAFLVGLETIAHNGPNTR